MSAVNPHCSECGHDRSSYDYGLEDYFCARCRHRAEHDDRRPYLPDPALPFEEDPFIGHGELPETLR